MSEAFSEAIHKPCSKFSNEDSVQVSFHTSNTVRHSNFQATLLLYFSNI